MTVADFGVGSGFFTREAARVVGESGKVYAIDIDSALLARLKSYAEDEGLFNIGYVRGNIEEKYGAGVPDQSMDVVLIVNTLFQVEDKNGLVEEAWRVVAPGGRAVVIDWKDSFDNMGPHPSHVVSKDTARSLFERGGFTYIDDVPAGDFHYGVILRKKN